ncbi:MAG: hypothetical protein U0R44_03160 [Candidatus Micrarchaeia archaeon]
MEKRTLALVLFAALMAFGCLQPASKIGCCLKANATDHTGCILYNDSSDTITDMIAKTNLESDGQKCNTTGNFCNVTLSPTIGPYLVPICTEDDILSCRAPNCLTMVCGDFKFKPAVGFGLSVSDDNKVSADIPPDTQDATAIQFYKAQCRFLPMDGSLKKIMKNSKSAINVFRLGVGGSFDEYEQYRYLFPISDRFCTVNPPKLGELRVDRYMNYLNPSTLAQYDPITGITNNCFDQGSSTPPSPLSFDESGLGSRSGTFTHDGWSIGYNYSIVNKDSANYKFAHWARLDGTLSSFGFGYFMNDKFFMPSSVNKKIDDSFYKKWLSIAHADTVYGLNPVKKNTTRAPFECDVASTECFSGICGTTTYNRVVMLTPQDESGQSQEVVTDCESYTDESRTTKIICAPTVNVTLTGPNTAPNRKYAKVSARTTHFDGQSWVEGGDGLCGIFDSNHLDSFVNYIYSGAYYFGGGNDGWQVNCPNVMSSSYFTQAKKSTDVGDITNTASTYLYWYNYTDGSWNNNFAEVSNGPPAGGALFFGNVEPQATYNGRKVIGYALATQSDVKNLLVVKNCEMVGGGVDYDIVAVPNDPTQWGPLKDVFTGYFRSRFSGMKAISTGDDCGADAGKLYDDAPVQARSYFYDFFFTGLPWVINVDKRPHPVQPYMGGGASNFLLANEIAIGERKINRFSETYTSASEASLCALRGLNSGYYVNPYHHNDDEDKNYYFWAEGVKPTYDILYSKYIVLFYDNNNQKIGKCALDAASGMPKIRTYGWCEPCTTSTLAYQTITATNDTYVPLGIGNVDNGGTVDLTPLQRKICVGRSNELRCANNLITDANDFSVEDGAKPPGPRTVPEASVLKERFGNYMKAGVMPVLDLSDASNWNEKLDEYDFQRLVGNTGAAVVIVDRVANASDASDKATEIGDRSALIHSRCFGCLTAFHVTGAASNQSLSDTAGGVFTTNLNTKFSVDMVTYDYAISSHTGELPAFGAYVTSLDPSANLTANYSQYIADSIYGYSLAILQKYGKPTMVVGLNLDSADSIWNTRDKQTALFDAIVLDQDQLIKAGLTGIIYSPARQFELIIPPSTIKGPAIGLEDVNGGIGTSNSKMCALEKAMQRMTSSPPIAVYQLTNAVNVSECVPCSSLEKAQGLCNDDALKCDDAIKCVPPAGFSEADIKGSFRCPENTVVDDPAGSRCPLCKDLPGTYDCTFSYANGTVEARNGSMTDLSSDVYLDIIGGIPRTSKCCLEDQGGRRYSYVKKSTSNQVNKPIAFSKIGDQEVDCGLNADIRSIEKAQTFCNVPIPLKDYDVSCTLSG